MHTITTRIPTTEEQLLIAERSKPDIASFGCIAVLFAIVPAWLLGKLCGWLGGFVSAEVSTYGQWIGWSVAAIIFVSVLVQFIPYERRQRLRASKDKNAQIIQEIHVIAQRVIQIGLINDNEPILAFDLGDNKILYLQGQWLRNAGTYGVASVEADPYDEFVNGLRKPYSFPCTEFTVTRFPNSGEVVGIRVAGEYLAPESEIEALRPEYEFSDSELFEGSVDDIAGVLAREHQRRNAR